MSSPRYRTLKAASYVVAAAALVAGSAPAAHAQASSRAPVVIPMERVELTPFTWDAFATTSSGETPRGSWLVAGLGLHYARDPLRLYNVTEPGAVQIPVSHRLVLRPSISTSFFGHASAAVVVPIVFQSYDDLNSILDLGDPPSVGLGTLQLVLRGTTREAGDTGFGGGLVLDVGADVSQVPMISGGSYAAAVGVLDWTDFGIHVSANVGALFQPTRTVLDTKLGTEVVAGLGAAYTIPTDIGGVRVGLSGQMRAPAREVTRSENVTMHQLLLEVGLAPLPESSVIVATGGDFLGDEGGYAAPTARVLARGTYGWLLGEPPPEEGPVCRPYCQPNGCGDDGCGGSCGECAEGTACVAGRCRYGAPKASFDASQSERCAPTTISLRSTSTGEITAYQWTVDGRDAGRSEDAEVRVEWDESTWAGYKKVVAELRVIGPGGEDIHYEELEVGRPGTCGTGEEHLSSIHFRPNKPRDYEHGECSGASCGGLTNGRKVAIRKGLDGIQRYSGAPGKPRLVVRSYTDRCWKPSLGGSRTSYNKALSERRSGIVADYVQSILDRSSIRGLEVITISRGHAEASGRCLCYRELEDESCKADRRVDVYVCWGPDPCTAERDAPLDGETEDSEAEQD